MRNLIAILLVMVIVLSCVTCEESSHAFSVVPDGNQNRAFMELPGVTITNNHSVFDQAKVVILEQKDSFSDAPRQVGGGDGTTNSTYGLVFLRKKRESGLPTDETKRRILFETLDARMKKEKITHWYIFQMRSTNEKLLGVYGNFVNKKGVR